MIRIGQKLKEERLKQGLSLDQIAKDTKIRASFLSAIERGEYNRLPSSAYAQGFVRNYSSYLGLPKKETLAIFRREFDEERIYKVLPEGLARNEQFATHKLRFHTTILVLSIVFLTLFGFLFYQYRSAFFDPPLNITSPKENKTYGQDILVSGQTDMNAIVTINNDPVALTEKGEFMKKISVFTGEKTIVIRAKNRFNRVTVVERHVFIKSN